VLLVLTILTLIFTTLCTHGASASNEVASTVSNLSDNATVTVTDANNQQQINMTTNAILRVRLRAQPGTGYGWQLVQAEKPLLIQVGEPQFERNHDPLLGGDETEVLSFRAERAGETVLKFHYARPWEKKEPQKVFEIHVTVRQSNERRQ
jgi:inhibitor of cysteine peptidase